MAAAAPLVLEMEKEILCMMKNYYVVFCKCHARAKLMVKIHENMTSRSLYFYKKKKKTRAQ